MSELKPGWRRVRFGEIVRLVSDRCDPIEAGIERFVGLEHIEPGDLRIRSWGDVADGTTFTNRFRPGQVLFGKRRAYQRKLAVADFEGVCSGDIYVLESIDPQRLLPELLPFICQADAFVEHAVGTSAGSLSPRTNWASLAGYEFALPPLEAQRRIADALNAGLRTVEESQSLAKLAWSLLTSALIHLIPASSDTRPLQSLCRTPVTYGIVKAGPHHEDGVPYVRVADITRSPVLTTDEMLRTGADVSHQYSRTILEPDDIIIAVKASRGVVGQVRRVPEQLHGGNLSRDVARIAPLPEVHCKYLYWALCSPQFMRSIQRRETGWKGNSLREITIAELRNAPVPWIADSEHGLLAAEMDRFEAAALSAAERASESQGLFRRFLEAALGHSEP